MSAQHRSFLTRIDAMISEIIKHKLQVISFGTFFTGTYNWIEPFFHQTLRDKQNKFPLSLTKY